MHSVSQKGTSVRPGKTFNGTNQTCPHKNHKYFKRILVNRGGSWKCMCNKMFFNIIKLLTTPHLPHCRHETEFWLCICSLLLDMKLQAKCFILAFSKKLYGKMFSFFSPLVKGMLFWNWLLHIFILHGIYWARNVRQDSHCVIW